MPKGYTAAQIALHWAVALLVLAQFLNDDAIGAAWRALRRNAPTIPGGFLVTAHIYAGIAILLFAVCRIALRLKNGTPPPAPNEPAGLTMVSATVHLTLYGLLIVIPLSGLTAWFGGVGKAAEAHEILTTALMWLILLHIAGALYQHFVLHSKILARMMPGRHI